MIIVLLSALLLDYFFAELQKFHPLVGFAKLATLLEERLNDGSSEQNRVNGLIATLIFLLPAWWISDFIIMDNYLGLFFEIIILYLVLGLRTLKQQAETVVDALERNELDEARSALSKVLGRDTQNMDGEGILHAMTKHILKNGNDVVIACIFWFIVAGAPGVLVYRMTNILDVMWGYKNARYKNFGFFIAKLDDLLNFIPARLTALGYAAMGNWKNAMHCWGTQAALWESPNAGVIMSAGAGALDVHLGVGDKYHGVYKKRPDLGCGAKAEHDTVIQACQLIERGTIVWVLLIGQFSVSCWFLC